ncbi:hypothetical protein F2Q68_00040771 [Brassica cretica]|uniref:Glycosyltransferase subfamily 4-like N-terminal domain-containing protein n=1 Tax=Brassica cretica TaxID=69181 RepID=A0A8S9MCJ5_BRACR|nr:hypothetical protein F2Q68_00040771 [Brassica cretica]
MKVFPKSFMEQKSLDPEDKKWGEMARKICLDDVEVKLGELEAELFVIKAINDNWGHIESGRDPENYFKYSVQDIERIVLDFFDFFEETMKEEDWRGNKDSVVQINGVGDMSLKRFAERWVIVVTTHEGVPEEFYGAKVIGSRSFPCPWYQKVPLSLALSPRIISEIARFKPDIIHASSPGITIFGGSPSVYNKWGEMARKICLEDVEVKLGELEAELFVIKAINDNWGHIESGRDPENYFKYLVQDIERIVLDFFDFFEERLERIEPFFEFLFTGLLKDGFVFEHDFLQVVDAVHIGWILLFVFICGIKFLNFQKNVKEKRTFVP